MSQIQRKNKHPGRGSVSRRFNYLARKERDPVWHKKIKEMTRLNQLKRRKKINKRCIDCNALISPDATRCQSCSSKRIATNTWKKRKK
jgi:ribosomal protein L40E